MALPNKTTLKLTYNAHHSTRAALSLVASLALSAPLAAINVRYAYHFPASLHLAATRRSVYNRICHIGLKVRSYRIPGVLGLNDRPALFVAWIDVVLERGTRGALKHSVLLGRYQCKHDGERGLEVSLCCLSQNQFVQC